MKAAAIGVDAAVSSFPRLVSEKVSGNVTVPTRF